ncbi:hypothetical protein Tco_1361720 [Tanacetum coccineum]
MSRRHLWIMLTEAMLCNRLDGDSYLLYEQSRSSVSVSKEILFDNFSRGLQRLMSTYVMLHSHIYKYGALHVSSFLYNRVLVLQAVVKAATKVASYCESYNRGCWLLRRLHHRLQAVVKVAIEVVGCCEGCQIGCRLLRRLPHRLQVAIKVACYYKGYNRGCWLLRRLPQRLLQRLHAAVKAETKAAVKAVTEAVVNAATKVAGCYKGYHITMKAATLLRRLQASNVAKKAVTLLRRLQHC